MLRSFYTVLMSASSFFLSASLRLCVSIVLLAGCNHAAPQAAEPSDAPADSPVSLWTRKTGTDWPIFLGPNQDSRSTETGIITNWPETGLKLIWHAKLGTSYGAPTIAGGRLMQFDRFGDKS